MRMWTEIICLRDVEWGAVVNVEMKIWLHKRWKVSWPAERILASHEDLCPMEVNIILRHIVVEWNKGGVDFTTIISPTDKKQLCCHLISLVFSSKVNSITQNLLYFNVLIHTALKSVPLHGCPGTHFFCFASVFCFITDGRIKCYANWILARIKSANIEARTVSKAALYLHVWKSMGPANLHLSITIKSDYCMHLFPALTTCVSVHELYHMVL
jgi:hypothetical protein